MSRRGEYVRKIESPVTKKQFHRNDDDIKVLILTKMTTERRVRTWRSQPMFFPADLAYQVISDVFSACVFFPKMLYGHSLLTLFTDSPINVTVGP